MGAAASAICSADCAARLDQASRLKVGGRWGVWLIAIMAGSRALALGWHCPALRTAKPTRFPTAAKD